MIKKIFYALLLICLLSSCEKSYHLRLALLLSGNNQPELEKVLEHYKNDPLKLKAAKFLIENMPGHYSYVEPSELTRYYNEIDSVCEIYKKLSIDDMEMKSIFIEISSKLKKELEQYKNDPLKFKASQFFIQNMPGHYAFIDAEPHEWIRCHNEKDSVYKTDKKLSIVDMETVFAEISSKYDFSKLVLVPDLNCVTADFLIDNIDRAFDVWQNENWATHLNFDEFCEYILPYKCVEGQILDNWREYLKDAYNADLVNADECSLYKNLAFKACDNVNKELKKQLKPTIITGQKIHPVYKLSTALKKPFGTCDDYAVITTAVMRAKGIPVSMDYTPQWAFRSWGHSWNVLLDNFGKNIVFLGADSPLGIPHKEDHPTAKVYRKSFAINREIEKLHRTERYVPYTFGNIHAKDVTSEYMNAPDIKVTLKEKTNSKYAYLAVFNNKDWIPVQFGKISGSKVTFEKMGRNIAYLPVAYSQTGSVPLANPFILTSSGEKKEIIPDLNNRQKMTLYRKYYLVPDWLFFHNRMAGAKIQASNYPDFRDAETVYTIQQSEITTGEIILKKQNKNYRYWRFYAVDDAFCSIAELYFYEKGNQNATYGKIIGSEGSFLDSGYVKENVFDKDPLTSYNAKNPSGDWVGMDFGKEINIEKIYYIPRGDGNSIVIGDEYELMYWDNNKWNSLGRKTADCTYISFDNCPLNALFLLHNRTTGVEERIFTYEDGKQVWW